MLLDIETGSKKFHRKLPEWFRVPMPGNQGYQMVKRLLYKMNLHTVCESAICPNIGECWGMGTATFMILGDICTRNCGFCAIQTGRPHGVDFEEPKRVARAVQHLELRHVVVTSVNRDDLPDGGAYFFSETIREIRRLCKGIRIEVLIPDFQGNFDALNIVMKAGPEIMNHNLETVPRLYGVMRPQAKYTRSLTLLKKARKMRPNVLIKSGIMVGAGEALKEIQDTISDIAYQGTQILTIGQYLQPSPKHLPVSRFYHPDEFLDLKRFAIDLGFLHVESGPLVRSSYHASDHVMKKDLNIE